MTMPGAQPRQEPVLVLRASMGRLSSVCGFFLLLGFSTPPAKAGEAAPPGVPAKATLSPTESFAERFRIEAGDRVFFAETSADLGSRARVALEAQAVWLMAHSHLQLIVEGHADDAGDDLANQRLSDLRAEAVRERLISLGVSPERVVGVGYGRGRPAAVCGEPSCAAHNRRAVTRIGTQRSAEQERNGAEALQPHRIRPSPRRLF